LQPLASEWLIRLVSAPMAFIDALAPADQTVVNINEIGLRPHWSARDITNGRSNTCLPAAILGRYRKGHSDVFGRRRSCEYGGGIVTNDQTNVRRLLNFRRLWSWLSEALGQKSHAAIDRAAAAQRDGQPKSNNWSALAAHLLPNLTFPTGAASLKLANRHPVDFHEFQALHPFSSHHDKLVFYPLKRLRILRASARALRTFASEDSPSKNIRTLQLGHSLE
jgi:hypothetical protein